MIMSEINRVSTEVSPKEYYLGMFDLIKGYAIISIVLNHTYPIFFNAISNQSIKDIVYYIYNNILLIYTCCIPLLFMISGFGFRKMEVKTCLKKQFKTLLLPYIIASVAEIFLFTFVQILMKRGFTKVIVDELLQHVVGLVFGLDNGSNLKPFGLNYLCTGPIWFLLALYVGWNIFNIILNYINSKYIPFAVLLVFVSGYILGILFHPYYFIAQGLVGCGFLYIGYLIREKQLFLIKLKPIVWIILIIGTILNFTLCNFVFSDFNFRTWTGIFELVCSGCAGFVLMYLSFCIDDIDNLISNKIRVIGRYSLWIICCHNVEVKSIPLDSVVRKVFGEDKAVIGFVFMLVVRVIMIYVMFKIITHIEKKINKAKKAKKRAQRSLVK